MAYTMKPKPAILAAIILASGAFGLSDAAWSKDNGKGHGHGKDRHQEESYHDRDDDGDVVIVIDNHDRTRIRDYIGEDYRRHCPPGLAKKHNGCLPPGQAKKHYRIGERLPDDVVFIPVPADLRERLMPVPAGYQYVQVDKDVLLISEAGKKVIDAVTLLSAVGN